MVFVEHGDITELIETGQFEEGVDLEAKRAGGAIPRNAWDSISAFANTLGGILVLGVDETEDGWHVSGVSDPDKMIQDLHNAMRDRAKISHEVSGNGDIWKEEVDGRQLVIVRVHSAPRRYKPVFLNGNRDMAYVRRNQGDMRCTQDELDRMRRESSSHSADAEVLPFLTLDDFEWNTITAFQELSASSKPELPHHARTGKAYLESIGAWRDDREQRQVGPTFAGIMMFGTDAAIQAIRLDHMIDYQRIPIDATPARRWSDRLQWPGNLFEAWQRIFPRLVRGLPTPFRLQGPQRIDRPDGLDSLREAFVNLLVHTDYRERRDAVIKHRDDGYGFRNPGDSWVDLRYVGPEGRSERRNPEIAKMFSLAGLADRAGSGFLRIQDEWATLGFRKPRVLSDPVQFEFSLELSLAGLFPADDRTWLESFGESWKDEEELALWFARRTGSVDNQKLREMTGQHMGDASRTLVSLKNRGYLVSQGSGRNVYYVLESESSSDNPAKRTDGDHKAGEDDHTPGEGDHKAGEDDHTPGEGDRSTTQFAYLHRESLLHTMMPIRESLRAPSTEEMRRAILAVCAIEPLSIAQLAELSTRSKVTVRRYVRELQRERKLLRADLLPGKREARYTTVSPETIQQQPLQLSRDEE